MKLSKNTSDPLLNSSEEVTTTEGTVKGDYKEITELMSAAEQGDAEAQCNLGNCYLEGKDIEQSYEEAVKWYRKAAEQGHAYVQHSLALCYSSGYGVEQSEEEAIKWWQKSAEQGNVYAQLNLDQILEEKEEKEYIEVDDEEEVNDDEPDNYEEEDEEEDDDEKSRDKGRMTDERYASDLMMKQGRSAKRTKELLHERGVNAQRADAIIAKLKVAVELLAILITIVLLLFIVARM